MKRKAGTFFMVLGTAMILSAVALLIYNTHDAKKADESAKELLERFEKIKIQSPEDEAVVKDNLVIDNNVEMDTIEIDEHSYIGELQIPDLDLNLHFWLTGAMTNYIWRHVVILAV